MIDNHFRDWNWKKVINLGITILTKIQEAVPERNDHCEDFLELPQSLCMKYPDLVSTWEHGVQEWELDPTTPNPFENSLQKLLKLVFTCNLAQEDVMVASQLTQLPLHAEVTPSILIDTGIKLEDQQYTLFSNAAL
ncbi:hypothetical protein JVU11DRAFT_9829 [Chiua virens]|nr:hypothetical protein JVU11DRAFT_9829 [Chiua virens]